MERDALMSGRYLDAKGEPIWEDAGGGVSGSEVVEYKRLPVRMKLEMDFGKLSKLLVECANAPLPVEPSYVQINPEKTRTGSRSERMGRPSSRKFGKPTRSPSGKDELDPAIVRVVIQGIVYIYKPPNEETLSAEGGALPTRAADFNSSR